MSASVAVAAFLTKSGGPSKNAEKEGFLLGAEHQSTDGPLWWLILLLLLAFWVWGLCIAYRCKAGFLEWLVAIFEPMTYHAIRVCVPCHRMKA